MDQESRDELNRITSLPAEALTPADIDFLYARRSYLNKGQKEEYSEVLKAKGEQVKEAATTKEE